MSIDFFDYSKKILEFYYDFNVLQLLDGDLGRRLLEDGWEYPHDDDEGNVDDFGRITSLTKKEIVFEARYEVNTNAFRGARPVRIISKKYGVFWLKPVLRLYCDIGNNDFQIYTNGLRSRFYELFENSRSLGMREYEGKSSCSKGKSCEMHQARYNGHSFSTEEFNSLIVNHISPFRTELTVFSGPTQEQKHPFISENWDVVGSTNTISLLDEIYF